MDRRGFARIFVCAALSVALIMGGYSRLCTAGAADAEVRSGRTADIQRRLGELGYYAGAADGVNDLGVSEALRRFQLDRGLEASGRATVLTLRELGLAPARGGAAMRIGDSGENVKRLQRRLGELGWYTGETDGEYGLELAEAVRRYQNADGLPVDGCAGIRTLLSLGLGGDSGTSVEELTSEGRLLRLARAIEHEAAGEPVSARIAVGAILLRNGSRLDYGGEPDALSLAAASAALSGMDPLGGALSYGRNEPEGTCVKIGGLYFSDKTESAEH